MAQAQYKEISAIARKRRDAVLSSFYGDLPELPPDNQLPKDLTNYARKHDSFNQAELDIIYSEAAAIIENVREKRWTALSVAKAFCKSAALAQQLVSRSFANVP